MSAELAEMEPTEKQRFAHAWIRRPDRDAYQAALTVMPTTPHKALAASREWVNDAEVLEVIEGYDPDEIDAMGVPTENDLIRVVWARVIQAALPATVYEGIDVITRIRQRSGNVTNNITNNTDNRSVMIFKDHGTDDQWEKELRVQQERLVLDAS